MRTQVIRAPGWLSLLPLFFACASTPEAEGLVCRPGRGMVPEIARLARDPLVRLERTGCCGFCPVYSVEVDIDGEASYLGVANVMTLGPETRTLSSSQLADLWRAVAQAHHAQLPIVPRSCARSADTRRVSLTTWPHSVATTIGYDCGRASAPTALRSLEVTIDQLVGVEGLIGTDLQRRACFFEQRDCSGITGREINRRLPTRLYDAGTEPR